MEGNMDKKKKIKEKIKNKNLLWEKKRNKIEEKNIRRNRKEDNKIEIEWKENE